MPDRVSAVYVMGLTRATISLDILLFIAYITISGEGSLLFGRLFFYLVMGQ